MMSIKNQGKLNFGTAWEEWTVSFKKQLKKAGRKGVQFYKKRRFLVQTLSFLFLLVGGWVITVQPWFRETTPPLVVKEAINKNEGGIESLTSLVLKLQSDLSALRREFEETKEPKKSIEEKALPSLTLIPPIKGVVVRKNGWEKKLTEWWYHSGIDVTAPAGTNVLACADGIVKEIKTVPSLGMMVSLAHGEDWISLYAHLTAVKVSVGQKVKQGTVLGMSSLSTCGPEPGIHFDLQHQGNSIDPLTMLLFEPE